jgi:predicted transcriptional regulator
MRIVVKVAVEMTPDQVAAYCADNGVDRGEIREDIRSYIRTALQDSPALGESGADVTVS